MAVSPSATQSLRTNCAMAIAKPPKHLQQQAGVPGRSRLETQSLWTHSAAAQTKPLDPLPLRRGPHRHSGRAEGGAAHCQAGARAAAAGHAGARMQRDRYERDLLAQVCAALHDSTKALGAQQHLVHSNTWRTATLGAPQSACACMRMLAHSTHQGTVCPRGHGMVASASMQHVLPNVWQGFVHTTKKRLPSA